jgi:hypothetical protein
MVAEGMFSGEVPEFSISNGAFAHLGGAQAVDVVRLWDSVFPKAGTRNMPGACLTLVSPTASNFYKPQEYGTRIS